ncbi:MAG: hypothetical protein V5A56_00385 [Halolamina sp.]
MTEPRRGEATGDGVAPGKPSKIRAGEPLFETQLCTDAGSISTSIKPVPGTDAQVGHGAVTTSTAAQVPDRFEMDIIPSVSTLAVTDSGQEGARGSDHDRNRPQMYTAEEPTHVTVVSEGRDSGGTHRA